MNILTSNNNGGIGSSPLSFRWMMDDALIVFPI